MEKVAIASGQELNFFTSRIADWTGWLSTFAVDSDGAYVGATGTSKSLSSDLDLKLLIALRSKTDAIVTTGATARAEDYRASRFAPIVFLTKKPESLQEIRAFTQPGAFENLVVTDIPDDRVFLETQKALQSKGLQRYLFEGGARTLPLLISQVGPIVLVLSISNLTKPEDLDPKTVLDKFLPGDFGAELLDDLVIATNRITTWLVGPQQP